MKLFPRRGAAGDRRAGSGPARFSPWPWAARRASGCRAAPRGAAGEARGAPKMVGGEPRCTGRPAATELPAEPPGSLGSRLGLLFRGVSAAERCRQAATLCVACVDLPLSVCEPHLFRGHTGLLRPPASVGRGFQLGWRRLGDVQGANAVVLYLPGYRWPFSLCATNEKSYTFRVSAAGC